MNIPSAERRVYGKLVAPPTGIVNVFHDFRFQAFPCPPNFMASLPLLMRPLLLLSVASTI
jgi:hypothetical protein